MTNGEKLIEIFPNNEHTSLKRTAQLIINPMTLKQQVIVVDKDFWDAEYKEPTTKNNLGVDCISRESVLKLIYDYKENHSNDREHYPINYGTLLDMIRWVLKLPPVTPQEPRKGHWVESHDDWGNGIITDKRYKCSVCHGKHIDQKTGEWHEVFDYKYPFCPNCGAKMTESEE